MMHLTGVFIGVTFLIAQINFSHGYKWITLGPNDAIPENTIKLSSNSETRTRYIGRARHYHLMLPAEVYNRTYAEITFCDKVIGKEKFEILVASERCEWKYFSLNSVPENIVRGGTWFKKEPIFIGKDSYLDYVYGTYAYKIASILLTSNQIKRWADQAGSKGLEVFICNNDDVWVDSSCSETPPRAISGGKTDDISDTYVARILSYSTCSIYPGQLIPEEGIATALDDRNEHLESAFCQVLTGTPNKYSWVWAVDGEIPDYAVIGAQEKRQLKYIARTNETLGYIKYSDILNDNKLMSYEFLVKNV